MNWKRKSVRGSVIILINIALIGMGCFIFPIWGEMAYNSTYNNMKDDLDKLDSKIFIPNGTVNELTIDDYDYCIVVSMKEYEFSDIYHPNSNEYCNEDFADEDESLCGAIYNEIMVNDSIIMYKSGRLILNGEEVYAPNYDYPEYQGERMREVAVVLPWIGVGFLTLVMIGCFIGIFMKPCDAEPCDVEQMSDDDVVDRLCID